MVIGDGAGRAFAAGGDIKCGCGWILDDITQADMAVVVEDAQAGRNSNALAMLADSFLLHWKMAHLNKPYVVFIDGLVSELFSTANLLGLRPRS